MYNIDSVNTLNSIGNFESAFADLMSGKDSLVESTLAEIEAGNQNRMRCILSGAPYATVDSEEIRIFLKAARAANPALDAEQLMDAWDLSLLSMCSRPAPTLQNRKQFSLREVASGKSGYAKVISFYLTRFFYSFNHFGRGMSTTRSISRMHFAADWFDMLDSLGEKTLRNLTFRLATDDSWLQLDLWKELGLMNNRSRTNGIMAPQHAKLRAWTLVPDSMPVSVSALHDLLDSLVEILVATEITGGVAAIASANQESINLAEEVARALGIEPKPVTAVVVKEDPFGVAYAEHLQYIDTLTGRPIKQAWSVVHGKGTLPGQGGPIKQAKAEKTPTVKAAAKPKKAKAESVKARAMREAMASILTGGFNFTIES